MKEVAGRTSTSGGPRVWDRWSSKFHDTFLILSTSKCWICTIIFCVNCSLQEKKKDIVAQAMREEKIFEEISRASAENSHAKKAASASATTSSSNHASSSVTTTTAASNHSTPVAIKSEPTASTSSANNIGTPKPSSEDSPKPGTSASAGVVTPRTMVSSRGRGAGRPIQQRQQQIMPRYWSYSRLFLHLLFRICKFWHSTYYEVNFVA